MKSPRKIDPRAVQPAHHLYEGHIYTRAHDTDLKALFERVRAQRQPAANVAPIKRAKP